MDPITTSALIIGGGNALTSWLGGNSQAKAQREANKMNLQIAREQMAFSGDQAERQMAFQERMSGTAYRRAMGDMKAAGLNPMLAFSQGGATTPSGAQGASAGATMQPVNPDSGISEAGAKALQALVAEADLANKQAQNELLIEQANQAAISAQKTAIEAGLISLQYPEAHAMSDFWQQNAATAGELKGWTNAAGNPVAGAAAGLASKAVTAGINSGRKLFSVDLPKILKRTTNTPAQNSRHRINNRKGGDVKAYKSDDVTYSARSDGLIDIVDRKTGEVIGTTSASKMGNAR